jgi:hypothetical protein
MWKRDLDRRDAEGFLYADPAIPDPCYDLHIGRLITSEIAELLISFPLFLSIVA